MKQYAFEALRSDVLDKYPSPDAEHINRMLRSEYQDFHKKIVVLDDDPTGIQTVHDVYVYTDWEEASINQAFTSKEDLFFLLTNSRSFSREQTIQVHTQIARRLAAASVKNNQGFFLISRGDSTLRGHYPLETAVLKDTLESEFGMKTDGEIICPFFKEGGRYTLNNIHYVKEGEFLTPAGNTEFAKDKTFGYSSSDLRDYVEEKSEGNFLREDCITISLEELRALELDRITEKLLSASGFAKIIVNAIDYIDVKIFCICLIRALRQGKNFIARSAAALPKVLGQITDVPLLTQKDLVADREDKGGIVIIGSHVKKTSDQLNALLESKKDLAFLEFNVNAYFLQGGLKAEVQRILECAESLICSNKTVIIYTSRQLLAQDTADKDEILMASVHISDALTSIIRLLTVKPRFIIAKGGITSSDVGTKGLLVKKALIMGQIKKGIPVWLTGAESKFPDTPYIIFPGNVGEVNTLREIVEELVTV